MDLYSLLSQVDITGVPPPTEAATSWWPIVTTVISLIVAAVAAIFTAWQKLREKKLENIAIAEQSRLQLEVEELKHQFESRKQLHTQLTEQLTALLAEGRELRRELFDSRQQAMEKDLVFNTLRTDCGLLQAKLGLLESQLVMYKNQHGPVPSKDLEDK